MSSRAQKADATARCVRPICTMASVIIERGLGGGQLWNINFIISIYKIYYKKWFSWNRIRIIYTQLKSQFAPIQFKCNQHQIKLAFTWLSIPNHVRFGRPVNIYIWHALQLSTHIPHTPHSQLVFTLKIL